MSTPDVVVVSLGIQGPQGVPGLGAPAGGLAGQVLAKVDNTNYNTQWVTIKSPNTGTAILDFGSFPGSNYAQVFVGGQPFILSSSTPIPSVEYVATANNTAADVQYYDSILELTTDIPVNYQGFNIYGFSTEKIQGKIQVSWTWA